MNASHVVVHHGYMAAEPTGITKDETVAVGAFITQVRNGLGMSRSKLSREAGVSEMTMIRVETGVTRDGERYLMRPTMAHKIAKALGIDPNELLEPLGYTPATQSTGEDMDNRIKRLESAVALSSQHLQVLAQTIRALTEAIEELNPKHRRNR